MGLKKIVLIQVIMKYKFPNPHDSIQQQLRDERIMLEEMLKEFEGKDLNSVGTVILDHYFKMKKRYDELKDIEELE